MNTNEIKSKCVLIIDEDLPVGLIANTSAILGITIGHQVGSIIGEDVVDASEQCHIGITNMPIPILKGTKEKINIIVDQIKNNHNDLILVDFSDIAQSCTDYEDYTSKVSNSTSEVFNYLGIGIYGNYKKVNKLTGSLPLLR